jgi:hypothetical protein
MEEKEKFAERWSRLKREARETPPAAPAGTQGEAPALPPVDQLTADSEYSPFMHPQVQDALRRAALKKLFSDPRFNVPDPFEPFSGDWTVGEAIPDEMMAALQQARTHLFTEKKEKEAVEEHAQREEKDPSLNTSENPTTDEPGRQDT